MKSMGGLLIYNLYIDINYDSSSNPVDFKTIQFCVNLYDLFLSKANNPKLNIYDTELKSKIKKLGKVYSKFSRDEKAKNLMDIINLIKDFNTKKMFLQNL